MRASERCFHLVLVTLPFTRSLPARIASMVDTKQSSIFEMAIGDFNGGYFTNKTNDCLMIGGYVCGLNSELFLHTDKKVFLLLETNKCRKAFAF